MPKKIAVQAFGGGVGAGRTIVDADTGQVLTRVDDPGWNDIAAWEKAGYDPAQVQSVLSSAESGMRSEQEAGRNEGGNSFLSIALPVALAAFGVPAGLAGALGGGTLGAIGAGSIIGAVTSLATGGNPLKGAVLGAVGGFAGSQLFGGEAAATGAETAGTEATYGGGGFDTMPSGTVQVSSLPSGGDVINAQDVAQTGVSSSPVEALNPQAGTPASYMDTPGGLEPSVQPDGSVSWGKKLIGIINSGLETAKENKEIVSPLITGGVMALGGAGQALLNQQTEEEKIQGAKDLLSQKTEEEARIAANKKAAIQGGSYFDAPRGFRPSGAPLRRSDGTLVYTQGLIRSRIGA